MWHVSEDVVGLLHTVPASLWLIVSVILLSASVGPARVSAVHDFAAHRLQHFDLHGVGYGTPPTATLFLTPFCISQS